jgi:hypothetical protein
MDVVCNLFHKVISRFGDIPWPARSPDITAPNFFLWGYLKERVHRTHPHTTQDLKIAIQNEIALINQDQNLLRRVFDNFVDRLKVKEAPFMMVSTINNKI